MKDTKTNKIINAGFMVIAIALVIGFIYLCYKGFRAMTLKDLLIGIGIDIILILAVCIVAFIVGIFSQWLIEILFKGEKRIAIETDWEKIMEYIFISFIYLIPFLTPLYYYYIEDTVMTIAASIMIVLIICLYVFTYFIITHTRFWKLKIQLRDWTSRIYYMLAFATVIVTWIRFGTISDICRENVAFNIKNIVIQFYSRAYDILFFIFMYKVFTEEKSNKYILFLRPFGYDKNLDDYECLQKIRSAVSGCTILRVGNPNKLFSFRIGVVTYFLPTVDWQSELKELIEHAKEVVIVLGSTEGVLWEVFNNIEHADKYIYYIDNTDDLEYILNAKYCYDFKDTFIVKFLSSLSSMNIEDISPEKHCAFTVSDGSVYFSNDISKIIRLKRKTIGTKGIRQWQIPNDSGQAFL